MPTTVAGPVAPASSASSVPPGPAPEHTPEALIAAEDRGLHKDLSPRHLQMIAIGSAIGTGLFLGAGGRLHTAGPSLVLLYAICGFFGYLILRSLGELVVRRPSAGSFVSYAREFFGEKAAFVSGWLSWLNWAMVAVAEATALALYVAWFGRYTSLSFLGEIPQWIVALAMVVLVVSLNLISVKIFGEMEFWFALVKVLALVAFLVIGTVMVLVGTPTGTPTGFALISDNGGWFPNGVLPAVIMTQGVVFAYMGIELVGTAAGETKDAAAVVPRAINSILFRVVLFYCGSVLLLSLLMPASAYSAGESPFVTFFDSIGVDYAAPIMQLVLITAAMSSMNAGIYSTGRIIHSMAVAGSAPKFARSVTRSGVPWGGIAMTAAVAMVGVMVNLVVPELAFEIMLNVVAIGVVATWGTICASHLKFLLLCRRGEMERPSYRAPGGIAADVAVLVFLAAVLVLTALDYPVGTFTLASLVVVVPALIGGWFLVRDRVAEIAAVAAAAESR
ncbi:amino acid permease [Micrococcus sp.]|uniref:amino acid permease n=1 Tax=Micrococcus sp. TaxID=1271 RepID=UPI002A9169C6|nr:amino acid permease [Micrococcus sp.]MDY6055040.1 amino acid permease [Micrococcus sp.]